MKKKLLCILPLLSLLALNVSARTWTSADGSKTFEAEYNSYNKTTERVVVYKGLKKMAFNIDVLSEADQKWLREKVAVPEKSEETENPDSVNITKNIEGSLSKLNKKRFKKYTLEKKPEYYIVYYSASW